MRRDNKVAALWSRIIHQWQGNLVPADCFYQKREPACVCVCADLFIRRVASSKKSRGRRKRRAVHIQSPAELCAVPAMRHPLRIFHFDESAHTRHLSVSVPVCVCVCHWIHFVVCLLGRCEALASLAPISSVFIIRNRKKINASR